MSCREPNWNAFAQLIIQRSFQILYVYVPHLRRPMFQIRTIVNAIMRIDCS